MKWVYYKNTEIAYDAYYDHDDGNTYYKDEETDDEYNSIKNLPFMLILLLDPRRWTWVL